ncbi:MAG: hypothetical protein KAH22_08330 [Thiotrichaceae bacterium]|nr:hypothetical protein [Thiotrichaceae bacterium]
MFYKIIRYGVIVVLSYFLVACNKDPEIAENLQTNTTPPKSLGFDLPNALAKSRSIKPIAFKAKEVSAESPIYDAKSYAYDELKEQINAADYRRLDVNNTLIYLESIWRDIEDYCYRIEADNLCHIPAGRIVFTYTESIMEQELALMKPQLNDAESTTADFIALEADLKEEVGRTLALGEINYIINSTGKYAHDITIDLDQVKSLMRPVDSESSEKQQIKWSDDKNFVFTKFIYADSTWSLESIIEWDQAAGVISYQDKEFIGLDPSSTIIAPMGGTFSAKVSRLTDRNGIAVESKWINNPLSPDEGSHKSEGEIDADGGYLKSSYIGNDFQFYNIETFDANGQRTGGKYCDSANIDCSKQSNWQDDEDVGEQIDPILIPETSAKYSNITVENLPKDVEFFMVMAEGKDPDNDLPLCLGFRLLAETLDPDTVTEETPFNEDNVAEAPSDIEAPSDVDNAEIILDCTVKTDDYFDVTKLKVFTESYDESQSTGYIELTEVTLINEMLGDDMFSR